MNDPLRKNDLSLPETMTVEDDSFHQLSFPVRKALNCYPYCALLKDTALKVDGTTLVKLAKSIAFPSIPVSQVHQNVSFTRVYVSREQASVISRGTRYSRTHISLPPHTDSSYLARPHELVVFQFIVADEQGGNSILAPIDDILKHLTHEHIALLKESIFPFGQGTYPILFGENRDKQIRYYRVQIDKLLKSGAMSLSDNHMAALDSLDRILNQPRLFKNIHLQAGDILLINNKKVLHGRTGFADGSRRMLHRIRLHAEDFGPGSVAKSRNSSPQSNLANAKSEKVSNLGKQKLPKNSQAEAHLNKAIQFVHSKHFNEALEQYRQAKQLSPNDMKILEGYGHLLLKVGQFEESLAVYRHCYELDPSDYVCGLALSSLLDDQGSYAEARDILENVVQHHLIAVEGASDQHKPTVLRARGLENCSYGVMIELDGYYTYRLRGGHFSVREFLDNNEINQVILNILKGNIDAIDAYPDFDLILNTISCPDLERSALLALARFIDRNPDVPVINHPRAVLDTTREKNYHRLNALAGVVFPRTERLRWDGASVSSIVNEVLGLDFNFPIIVRMAGTQTGHSVGLINSIQELKDYFSSALTNREYYLIQFYDRCRKHGFYNKTRIFCINGQYYPVANLFRDFWSIHSGDRYYAMSTTEWMQEEERAYLGNCVDYLGKENYNKLLRIRDMVGLDFFGIDFTIWDDQSLFIFELNPAMRHNFDHVKTFPYTEPYLKKISVAFGAMVKERIDGSSVLSS
ncbi:MAG: TauD/TfdA family dioxygenase [Methylococcales bacterium]